MTAIYLAKIFQEIANINNQISWKKHEGIFESRDKFLRELHGYLGECKPLNCDVIPTENKEVENAITITESNEGDTYLTEILTVKFSENDQLIIIPHGQPEDADLIFTDLEYRYEKNGPYLSYNKEFIMDALTNKN